MNNDKVLNKKVGHLILVLANRCESILKKEINKEVSKELATIIGYYLTIVEYSKTLGILVKEETYISIPHLARSVLEAVVDLINLCKNLDYYYVLKKISLNGNKRRAKSWRINTNNRLHPDIDKLPENFRGSEKRRNKELNDISKRIEKVFQSNITELRFRFEAAGLDDLYESIYWLTSPEVHNDLSDIWDRHIREKEGESIFFSKPVGGIKKYNPHISLILSYLIAGLGDVLKKLENKEFEKYYYDLEDKKEEILLYIS